MAKSNIEATYNRFLQVRINDALRAVFARKAKKAGFTSISEWARDRLLHCDERRHEDAA